MNYGNKPLTPHRCMEIWRSVSLTFKDPRNTSGLKNDFHLKGVSVNSTKLEPKLNYLIKKYRTEDRFIIAAFAYFSHFFAVKGATTSIYSVDTKLIDEAYVYFMGRVESIEYNMKEFLSELSLDDLMIDPKTQRPVICSKRKECRNFWYGEPVTMAVLCRFTNLNLIWNADITDVLKKHKNSTRSILTTILWCVIKRYCNVDSLAIKKAVSDNLPE